MTNKRNYDQPTHYLIRIQGTIDPTWSDWFGGFTITSQNDETVLEGEVNHQAALHGILAKINELGLSLISVDKLTDKSCSYYVGHAKGEIASSPKNGDSQ